MPKNHKRSVLDRFNRILTAGSIGGIVGLGLTALVLIIAGASFAALFHIHVGDGDLSHSNAFWAILQRAIDPGQLAGERTWDSRLLLLVVTALGILLISTLISIVNSTIERRIEQLRRGRGPVHASDHIVVLGWNSLGTKVTEELAEACLDNEPFEVVVLSDHDPYDIQREVQEDLRRRESIPRNSKMVKHPETWLTVRRGDLRSVSDLALLAQLNHARSVLILSHDQTDAETTMIILAIIAGIQGPTVTRTTPLNIVASFNDTNVGLRLRERIHRLSVESTRAGEPIAELLPITPAMVRTGIEAQVARHRGLSEVYRDLLDFDGDEIYIVPAPEHQRTFGDIAACEGIVPIGIVRDGSVDLWPDWDAPLADTSLAVIARSEHVAKKLLEKGGQVQLSGRRPQGHSTRVHAEKILVIGWNSTAENLVLTLLATSPRESQITVLVQNVAQIVSSVGDDSRIRVIPRNALDDPLGDRAFVEQFDHVVVLAREDEQDPTASDASVLSDVLACRINIDESSVHRDQPATVVAELRQSVSKYVAGVRLADDLLLSDSLGASAMVQLAVNPHLLPVLSALLEANTPDHPQLMSLEGDSATHVGKSWTEVRRDLLADSGDLALAIRESGLNGRVEVNPAPNRRIIEGEEVIVFGRLLLATSS